ncbi:hypothetical protein EXE10_19420 [Acinetobacter sp. WCHAc060033]|uniref:Uncharacterized protein n=1 Tax=Acinetobacter wuhouensis TaxID=1879050 RepID=A0A3G2T1T6_9GAMM|nr:MULTISPECIES: hypothetical protein [Acinetobacter]AYO54189.1 hypothetical protein CDG68_11335 [Acinetobacter wuhouensis]RZG77060.1 hypothetical protein EXE10_19420 [Acinetobacter sp. WCHAc060033]
MNCKYCGGTTLFGVCQERNCGAIQPKAKKKDKSGSRANGWKIIIGIIIFLGLLQWIVNSVNSLFR